MLIKNKIKNKNLIGAKYIEQVNEQKNNKLKTFTLKPSNLNDNNEKNLKNTKFAEDGYQINNPNENTNDLDNSNITESIKNNDIDNEDFPDKLNFEELVKERKNLNIKL